MAPRVGGRSPSAHRNRCGGGADERPAGATAKSLT